MIRKILGIALAGAGTVTIALGAAPAAQAVDTANTTVAGRCTTVKHGDTAGFTSAGAGAVALTGDGVLMSTGTASDADRVDWKTTLATPVDADTVTEATYTTTKTDVAGPNVSDAALTAYRIFVRISGQDGVLIYEPYWNTTGNPPRGVETTWNVLTGKLWTSSTTIPGLPKTAGGPPEKTFAQVRADNPDMLVTGIGLGLGTYNRGTKSLTNDVHFKSTTTCVTHEWSTRFVKPTPSSPAPSSPKPSVTPSTSPTATTGPVGNPGPGTSSPACNPNYPQLCLTHEVNCSDLTARNFTVLAADPYGLDGPIGPGTTGIAGIGCEDPNKPTPYIPGTPAPTTPAAPTSSPAGALAVTPADYSGSQLSATLIIGVLAIIGGASLFFFAQYKGRRRA